MFTMFELCRATPEEVRRPLPGDEVIPRPIMSQTHAITIDVPPDQVWPWLVQMGCGRAGWYSYDLLDNGGRQSATTINPAWQHLAIGEVMSAVPGARDAFVVMDFTPGNMLLLGVPIVTTVGDARESAPASAPTSYPRTMVYVLEETPAHQTRLITRGRGGDVPPLPSPKARKGSKHLVLFDDVDVATLIEREMAGQKQPIVYIIRAANTKTLREIHQEIRAAQVNAVEQAWEGLKDFGWLPLVVFRAFWPMFWWLKGRSPSVQKKYGGTVGVSAVGMFGKGAGWGIPINDHTLDLTLGGLASKPGVVDGHIAIRDYLCITKMTVLVAYASKHGSTQGIAERIAEQFRQLGKEAEARPVDYAERCAFTKEVCMKPVPLPESHRDLLDGGTCVVLTTVMPDGQPQVTPVWCNREGDYVLLNTMRGFRKERNMRANPKVTLLAYDPRHPLRHIEIRGTVVEMAEEGALEHLDHLTQLYLHKPDVRFFGDSIPASLQATYVPVKIKVAPTHVRVEG